MATQLEGVPRLAPSAARLELLEAWVLLKGVPSWKFGTLAVQLGEERVAPARARHQELQSKISPFHALTAVGMAIPTDFPTAVPTAVRTAVLTAVCVAVTP